MISKLELKPDDPRVKPVAAFPPFNNTKKYEEIALTFEEDDSTRRIDEDG